MGEKDLGKCCEALYQDAFETTFNDVFEHARVKVPWKTCPYPKGENELKNYLLKNIQDLLPPYLPGGEKWQIQLRLYKGGEVLGGYNIFALLRNEQSLLAGG